MEEKRRNPRFGYFKHQIYTLNFKHEARKARLANFSRDGLGIESPYPLQEDSMYSFHIEGFGLKRAVPCQARVTWVKRDTALEHCSCGARITEMKPSDKIDLIEVLYQDWKQSITENIKLNERNHQ